MACEAASKFQCVSLNDHLVTGPDLLSSLTDILFRFREGKVERRNESEHLAELIGDIVRSKGWRQLFATACTAQPPACENKLAQEYKTCKEKQSVQNFRERAKHQKQKVLIGNTKAKSRISLAGETPGHATSCMEAAQMVGRLRRYGDEKRRLLSIIASDYSYGYLQKVLGCSPNTAAAARVHHILFGRGGVPPPHLEFKRQRVSPDIIEEVTEFLHRDDITRTSSCAA